MEKKKCPLAMAGRVSWYGGLMCSPEDCALYDDIKHKCGLLVLAQAVDSIDGNGLSTEVKMMRKEEI